MPGEALNRVAERAATIKPTRVALNIVAFPFYVIGLLVGFVWLAVVWSYAAVLVGFSDAKAKREATQSKVTDGAG